MNPDLTQVLSSHGVDPAAFNVSSRGVLTGVVPSEDVLALWHALREAFSTTGLWPVIRGSADSFESPEESEDEPNIQPPTGSIRHILNDRFKERCELLNEAAKGFNPNGTFEAAAALADGSGVYSFGGRSGSPAPWPATSDAKELNLQTLDAAGSDDVVLVLVPVKHPSEVPIVLGFGGWNECPMPELLAAALKDWQTRFDAVPICITDSVLECFVGKPPSSEADCTALAAEQWVLCEDIVSQGTQSVRALAVELQSSPGWFFWWD